MRRGTDGVWLVEAPCVQSRLGSEHATPTHDPPQRAHIVIDKGYGPTQRTSAHTCGRLPERWGGRGGVRRRDARRRRDDGRCDLHTGTAHRQHMYTRKHTRRAAVSSYNAEAALRGLCAPRSEAGPGEEPARRRGLPQTACASESYLCVRGSSCSGRGHVGRGHWAAWGSLCGVG
jgi:hypothetical protein